MSLTEQQQSRTSSELEANLEVSGLDEEEVCRRLDWTLPRLEATRMVSGADPADVWRLRDALLRAVAEAGEDPVPFTVLTNEVRSKAAGWFGI